MFLSLGIIFGVGILGGILFEKIHLPKIVFYLILGILMSPTVSNIVSEDLMNISSYLRQIALVIILTRSGLSLDIATLKKIGASAILMCFVPACFEILGIAIFGPVLLNISLFEALLVGSVLAAVSPAIVVPRMLKLMSENYGNKNKVPQLIMAGSSCDDIFVIVLFYSFKNVVSLSSFNFAILWQIPTCIILGILQGIIVGLILAFVFRKLKFNRIVASILTLGVSLLLVYCEQILKSYISISSLLSIIVIGIVLLKFSKNIVSKIQKTYTSLWSGFEILLFSLIGCAINVKYAFSTEGLVILGLIFIGLFFRSIGVLVSISFGHFTLKECLFIVIAYLPKATVQASIGGICLAEGLSCGELVLTCAIISILVTAPIGAILMDLSYKKLLNKDELEFNLNNLKRRS